MNGNKIKVVNSFLIFISLLLLHLIAIVVQVVISLLFVFEFRQNKNTIEFNLDECVGTEFSYVWKVYMCLYAKMLYFIIRSADIRDISDY